VDIDPITAALSRLVTTLDVIGLEAFVPDPLRAPGKIVEADAPWGIPKRYEIVSPRVGAGGAFGRRRRRLM
jgi:hypothetical protein